MSTYALPAVVIPGPHKPEHYTLYPHNPEPYTLYPDNTPNWLERKCKGGADQELKNLNPRLPLPQRIRNTRSLPAWVLPLPHAAMGAPEFAPAAWA
jgi:hypothetical protein